MVIKQLIYLLALERERHFGAAAARCHITQPTLSMAIRQLEDELGVPVVERGHRFLGFTPQGEEVLAHARRIVAECDALKQSLSALRQGLSGTLTIGAVPSALPMMAHLTGRFLDAHPAVSIILLSMSSVEIQQGLDRFDLDAGVTYLDNEPVRHVRTQTLYREAYVLLAPSGSEPAGRGAITWAAAAELPLCRLTPNMQNRRIIDAVFATIGATSRSGLETNSIISLCAHVQSGRWFAVLPRALIAAFGAPAGTVAIPLVDPIVRHDIGLVIADREPPAPLAKALLAVAGRLDLATAGIDAS